MCSLKAMIVTFLCNEEKAIQLQRLFEGLPKVKKNYLFPNKSP